jgi:putative SOS response-associated peptidase YedK
MCGRFVSARRRQELLAEFAIERDRTPQEEKPADYNVAPTKQIYAVMDRREEVKGEGEAGGKPERELRLVRWGLVPFWAKDPKAGARMINARAETVATKPAFRAAFARRRCIIPVDGYYEWQPLVKAVEGDGAAGGKPVKQPFYICRTDGGILAFAGIYELWHDKSVPEDDANAWLWTGSIVTTDATDELGQIHDRMPMMIAPDHWADWLDPENKDTKHLMATMLPAVPATASGVTSYPVSTAVNSVRNNGPTLIESAPAGG